MKKILLGLMVCGAALALCGADKKSALESGAGVENVFRLHRLALPQPHRFERPENIVNDSWGMAEPTRFEGGELIRQLRETRPPSQHAAVTRDRAFAANILREQDAEREPGHYYWHNTGGVLYAHLRDERGLNWYGFYHGERFYWCRYFLGYWWWYDAPLARWAFWWQGYWWWWGPGGIPYVYVNGDYYPYDITAGGVVVKRTQALVPPKAVPARGNGVEWASPDKTRTVLLNGPDAEAFLYDTSGPKLVFLAYLGEGVTNVRYAGGAAGQVLVDFKDGDFAVYDRAGKSLEAMPYVPPELTEPPLPGSVPAEPAPR